MSRDRRHAGTHASATTPPRRYSFRLTNQLAALRRVARSARAPGHDARHDSEKREIMACVESTALGDGANVEERRGVSETGQDF